MNQPILIPPYDPVSGRDREVIRHQLGRPVRNAIGIAARCVCSNPVVVVTQPRLDNGEPFPTFYYLTHPGAIAALSKLESQHVMVEYTDLIAEDEGLRAAYVRAHESYICEREKIEFVEEISGISAGGMPVRVKCLHALAAHALAVGPGVNPLGDMALEAATWSPKVCVCKVSGTQI